MPEHEERTRKGLIDSSPQIPFPLRLVTLIGLGSCFYFFANGLSFGGVLR